MTQEDDELVMHLECPECGHNRKRPLSRGDGLAYDCVPFHGEGTNTAPSAPRLALPAHRIPPVKGAEAVLFDPDRTSLPPMPNRQPGQPGPGISG